MKTDLTYTSDPLITYFTPHTVEGEKVWREIVGMTGIWGGSPTSSLPVVLHALKKAGYTFCKARVSKSTFTESDDAALADALFC